jgi:hypothetical protein
MNETVKESFSAKDFSPVDDVLDAIDSANENKEDTAPDGDESKETNVEAKADESQTTDDLGTQNEQSDDNDDGDGDNGQDEDPKPDEADLEALVDIDVADDEELVYELEDGRVIPVSEILSDYTNNESWKKSNTEKSQDLADQKKGFDSFIKGVGVDEIKEALENDELMEALDDWYDDKDSNPFRKLNQDALEEYTQTDLREAELNIKQDFLTIEQSTGEALNADARSELAQYSLDNNVSLSQAHTLMSINGRGDRVAELEAELKIRNKELSQMKKTEKKAPKTTVSGKGAKRETFEGSAGGWKEADAHVKSRLGL